MHPVAFTARQITNVLLLLGAFKIKAPTISTRGSFVIADLDKVRSAGDFLPDSIGVIQ
jgi:hypothetical protein